MLEQLNFSKGQVLVCGDVMLDRYWSGPVRRVSPEAPVPVVRVKDCHACAGGAANVALNTNALGVKSQLLGVVGRDAEGRELSRLLVAAGVEAQLLARSEQKTICKLRVMSANQQLLRVDFEEEPPVKACEALSQHFSEGLQDGMVVVLSDYAKGTLSEVQALIQAAKAAGVPVLVDPKGADFSRYRGATLLTPNRREFEAVAGGCATLDEMVVRAKVMVQEWQLEALLVTLSEEGMLLVTADGYHHLPTKAREVFDVTGAGDTVIGVLAASLAAGASLEQAAYLANVAAGLVVAKLGAGTVSLPELKAACVDELSEKALGVLVQDQVEEVLALARSQGERIVMTNGCFDLLHAGHVQYLQQAKALGDRLMVLVNSDDSVGKLKGPERPLNPLDQRMAVLAALEAVDWVVPFSEETPQCHYARWLPDVLVKGGDYQVEEIAGAKEVLAAGGEVEVLSFKPGCSTTSVVEKIKESVTV
jgi:D-beta-D-heptose 7-phosphate kinase/D-beta-D-heptose 1-phosphate adenosyltransferase